MSSTMSRATLSDAFNGRRAPLVDADRQKTTGGHRGATLHRGSISGARGDTAGTLSTGRLRGFLTTVPHDEYDASGRSKGVDRWRRRGAQPTPEGGLVLDVIVDGSTVTAPARGQCGILHVPSRADLAPPTPGQLVAARTGTPPQKSKGSPHEADHRRRPVHRPRPLLHALPRPALLRRRGLRHRAVARPSTCPTGGEDATARRR